MTVSHFRVMRSETRDLADLERLDQRTRWSADSAAWGPSDSRFFTAFVIIAAALAALVLVLH